MSLDITILDSEGYPTEKVSVGVDDHHQLMQKAKEQSLLLLTRMSDYYQDAEYNLDEVLLLSKELKNLIEHYNNKSSYLLVAKQLLNLTQTAIDRSEGIVTIAD